MRSSASAVLQRSRTALIPNQSASEMNTMVLSHRLSSLQEELARVIPVIERLAAEPDRLQGASISIDTFDSKVGTPFLLCQNGKTSRPRSSRSLASLLLPCYSFFRCFIDSTFCCCHIS